MKKKLLYLLLLFSGIASAQIVNIPDPVFKNWLLSADADNDIAYDSDSNPIVVDSNGDYEIQESEALLVWNLNLADAGISDATGLEAFTNLRVLTCHDNQSLTSLDLTSLSNLEQFTCDGGTGLENLNFSGLSNLEFVFIMGTNLDTIDLTGTTGMESFILQDVPVTHLDFSDMVNLIEIGLFNTNLVNINLESSPIMEEVRLIGNLFLETVNIKNGDVFVPGQTSEFNNNPNFNFICIDEGEETALEAFFFPDDVPAYSSYCSFTPGGVFNTITGTAIFDSEANGCEPEDSVYPFVKLNINDGTDQGSTFTNALGEYNFYTEEGNFTVTPVFENDWFTVTPAEVNFPAVDGSVSVHNFCIEPNGEHDDIEVVMVPLNAASPGFEANYKIVYRNKGNQVSSGAVTCNWDYQVLNPVTIDPAPTTIAPGSYTWDYSDLQPFENREILMTLEVSTPTDDPPVNNGDILPFTASVNTLADEIPDDNTYLLNQEVVGSYDPNNIICIQGDIAPPDVIGEYLHYVVNFENTGTAPASFIVVKHLINEEDFDISTLQILNSSHNVAARITGNKVEFIFDNINLSALDHGNILFKLKSKQSLQPGDNVINKANIYFDYNYPVETNEANTVFEILSTSQFEIDNTIIAYPNPTSDHVAIQSAFILQSISLYDIQGRLLQTMIVNDAATTLDVSSRAKGVYFLKITSDKGIKVEKIVKQ